MSLSPKRISSKRLGSHQWSVRHGSKFIVPLLGIYLLAQNIVVVKKFAVPTIYYDPFSSPVTKTSQPHHEHEELWEIDNKTNCFHIDNVCSWKNGWFYGHTNVTSDNNTTQHSRARQPTATLILGSDTMAQQGWHDIGNLNIDYRIRFNISSTSHAPLYDEDSCSFSSTPNHLVVQSFYNDMMGEFYARLVLGLFQLMVAFPPRSNNDIQIYVHFVDERAGLYEGHKLILSGLPSNNKFDSFASIMPGINESSCQCYRRMIFCGYNVIGSGTSSSLSGDGDENNGTEDVGGLQDNKVVFVPTGVIDERNNSQSKWQELRSGLIDRIQERYQDLDRMIYQYRRRILIDNRLITSLEDDVDVYGGNSNDWKFVGVTRRKKRRAWLNIDDSISACNEKFRQHRIVCVIIDVEDVETAEEQLLMHRSLHALVGIHGAQLTQGVLLPSHAHILELLPHIPPGDWGGWVASTNAPTPLGIIFHNTDLNHFGYPLGNETCSPSCTGFDKRDFNVSVTVVEDFVSTFLLKRDDNITMSCDAMEHEAERKKFVLYNVFCLTSSGELTNQHHYW